MVRQNDYFINILICPFITYKITKDIILQHIYVFKLRSLLVLL